MSRKITIYKYEGNTDWSAEATDSYGKLHHLGYYNELSTNTRMIVEAKAKTIWKNEVEPKEDLLGNAIAECVQMDKDRGVEPSLD